jgi:hypothetical protein
VLTKKELVSGQKEKERNTKSVPKSVGFQIITIVLQTPPINALADLGRRRRGRNKKGGGEIKKGGGKKIEPGKREKKKRHTQGTDNSKRSPRHNDNRTFKETLKIPVT